MLSSLFGSKMKEPDIEDLLAEAKALAERGEFEAALAIWGPLAHKGVARAANNVGACFSGGLGVTRNLELAARWLTIAAEAGDPAGQRNLATAFFQGHGVEQNFQVALRWYRAAAEAGDAAAQDMLSWMLLEGGTIPGDPVEARRWAEAAASQNVASAHDTHGYDLSRRTRRRKGRNGGRKLVGEGR